MFVYKYGVILYVVLRTLMGHKANVCSLDFHPFGEYLASGSVDTNIKVMHITSYFLSMYIFNCPPGIWNCVHVVLSCVKFMFIVAVGRKEKRMCVQV